MFIILNDSNIIIRAKATSYGLPDEIELNTDLDITEVLGYKYENGQLVSTLESARREKIQDLQVAYNTCRKITIQNGETLIIEHHTPERDEFLKKLLTVLQESSASDVAISYQQEVNNSMYVFSALPTIWNYVFKDLFLVDRKKIDGTPTGFKESVREHNKMIFDATGLKIQKAATVEQLNAISWEFVNPNGVFVNVNEEATKMLNDDNVDDFTKLAINQLIDPITGEVHLINIVE